MTTTSTKPDELREKCNLLGAEIGRRRRAGEPADELIAQHKELTARLELSANKPQACEPATTASLQTQIITQVDEFAALRDDWHELFETAGCYPPFMQWEWLFNWWKWFGQNKQLRLITVRDGTGRLVGLAPMMLGVTRRGRCRRSVLAFIATGDESPGAKYPGVVVAQDNRGPIHNTIAEALASLSAEWSGMELWRLVDDPNTWELLAALRTIPGATMITRQAGATLRGPIPSTYEQFINMVRSPRRRTWLRSLEREAPAGNSISFLTCTSPEQLQEALELGREWSIGRQAHKGQVSSWVYEASYDCLCEIVRQMWQRGSVRADLMYVDGEPAAVKLGFVFGDTYYMHLPAFAQRFAGYAPFHRLMAARVKSCIAEGVTTYDCLADHDYLWQYFGQAIPTLEAVVVKQGVANLAKAGLRLAARGVRSVIERSHENGRPESAASDRALAARAPLRFDRPPAVVIIPIPESRPTGIEVIRCMGRAGVPTIAVSADRRAPSLASRYLSHRFCCPNPFTEEEAFIDYLVSLGRRITPKPVLFAATDYDAALIGKHQDALRPFFHYPYVSQDTLKSCISKLEMLQAAKQAGFTLPLTHVVEKAAQIEEVVAQSVMPSVVKPIGAFQWEGRGLTADRSFESHFHCKATLARSREELREMLLITTSQGLTTLVQENVPGLQNRHFILNLYADRQSRVRAVFMGRKVRQYPADFGSGSVVEPVTPLPQLVALAQAFVSHVGYHGIANMEWKHDSRTGEFKFMEINPRPWTWTILSQACGVNIPYLAYLDLIGQEVPELAQSNEVKFFDLVHDLRYYLRYHKGDHLGTRLPLGRYLASLRGPKEHAFFAPEDRGPGWRHLRRELPSVLRSALMSSLRPAVRTQDAVPRATKKRPPHQKDATGKHETSQ